VKRFLIVTGAAAAVSLILAACSGSEGSAPDGGSPAASGCAQDVNDVVIHPSDAPYIPVLASSDIAVGENRVVVGLIDSQGEPVTGAQMRLRIYCYTASGEQIDKLEVDTTPVTITRSYTHTHEDGTVETHTAGELGVYVTNISFDEPGKWGLEATGAVNGQPLEAQPILFDVRARSLSPAIGDPAPRSVQPILKDVADIREIDTSAQPIAEMHDMTIAEAVTSGKPTVIAFATPAFCVSQLCGPAKEIVDTLFRKYGDQANFIHVEPYFLEEARAGKGLCPIPIMNVQYAANPEEGCPVLSPDELPPAEQSWNLSTEPWVFVVDKDGNIAAKFESAFSEQELEDALTSVLTP